MAMAMLPSAVTVPRTVPAPPSHLRPRAYGVPCQSGLSSVSIDGHSVEVTINFRSGHADLTPEARAALCLVGEVIASDDAPSKSLFLIEGHADNDGDRIGNMDLSERRARAVVDFFISEFGIERWRLEPVGMGEEKPLFVTPPGTSYGPNRRVHIVPNGVSARR